jgi:putative peptidoglycan lipid II flippase
VTGLTRYALASIGPVGSAAAQFLLSLILLRSVSAGDFGSFSFLLIVAQLAQGVWSALFCAPLLVLLAQSDGRGEGREIRAILTNSLALAVVVGAILAAIAAALGLGGRPALLFGSFASVSLVRWLGRAEAYARAQPMRAVASDLVYSLILAIGLASLLHRTAHALDIACLALLVGAAAGLLPLGARYLREQFGKVSIADIPRYGPVWRAYSRWSLIGVVTTEATANCHSYIVTLVFGPAAFAALAATALAIRPITVGTNALVDLERAQMAREIAGGRLDSLAGTVRLFRLALLLIWGGTAAAAVLLLAWAPHLIFPPRFATATLWIGVGLWIVVAIARVLRAPESALLQAAGSFRPLALASVYACGISIVAVLVMLALRDPLWSILGIFVGEAAFAGFTWAMARRWLAEAMPRLALVGQRA